MQRPPCRVEALSLHPVPCSFRWIIATPAVQTTGLPLMAHTSPNLWTNIGSCIYRHCGMDSSISITSMGFYLLHTDQKRVCFICISQASVVHALATIDTFVHFFTVFPVSGGFHASNLQSWKWY